MTAQRCGRCKQERPLESFSPSYRGKPGTWCKPCFASRARGEAVPSGKHTERMCDQCGKAYVPRQLKRNAAYCSRACGQRARRESGRERAAHLLRRYGITLEDYERMLAAQGGGCALCGVRPDELKTGRYRTYLHVDHDEQTGQVRGLLCPDHNLMLGQWKHDPALLRRAAEYLEVAAR